MNLEYSKKDIIDKMNSYFGYAVVEKLKLISFDDEKKNCIKESSQNNTLTQIEELSKDAVITEIARMLGGENFSEESRAHAEQMIISN